MACACAALCTAVQAQQVQLYGTIDAAVGQIEAQPAGAPAPLGAPGTPNVAFRAVKGVHSGTMQTSHWGLRGTEDLGNGLKARFQIESFLRVDTGQSGRSDTDSFWARSAYVALGGGFGEVKLGTTPNPTWISSIFTNALGSNSVFSPTFRQLYNGGTRGRSQVDTALTNSVQYTTPTLGGVQVNAALQAGEGVASGTRYNYSANVIYRGGPMVASVAIQDLRHSAPPAAAAAVDQTIILAGAAVDLGFARLFAQYVDIDNDQLRNDDKVPSFGVTVPLAGGQFQFAASRDKQTFRNVAPAGPNSLNSERTTVSLGYVYGLSKRTEVYTFLMRDQIENRSRATGATVFDDKGDSYVVGIRHQF